MDASWIGVVGAAVGAVAGLSGSVIQVFSQKAARESRVREEAAKLRLDDYIDLLTSARRLRFFALRTFQGATPAGDVDEMLTAMSRSLYRIIATADPAIAEAAHLLRDEVVRYYRLCRDHPESEKRRWQAARTKASDASIAFNRIVRADYASSVGVSQVAAQKLAALVEDDD